MSHLALDVATSTGWAVFCDGDATKRSAHWQLFAAKKELRRFANRWRYFPEVDKSVGWGFWDLRASDFSPYGHPTGLLLRCLLELNKFVPIDYLSWEQRFPSTNFETGDVLATIGGGVAAFCDSRKLPVSRVRAVDNQHWRPHFLGKAEYSDAKAKTRRINKLRKMQGDERKASSTKELKLISMARAGQYGFKVDRDDEADAIGILDYELHSWRKIVPPWRIGEVFQPILTVGEAA